eukprot:COSAG05_NODE_3537_length_2004_cov_4.482168_3_plen_75_part_00
MSRRPIGHGSQRLPNARMRILCRKGVTGSSVITARNRIPQGIFTCSHTIGRHTGKRRSTARTLIIQKETTHTRL